METIQDIENALMAPRKREQPVRPEDLLSSGSTLLNLAVSGNRRGLYAKGRYTYVVGDSMSGKTWLVLTALAEACRNSGFDDYRLIYDDAEDGALMKLEKFFGAGVAERIEPPAWDESDEEKHSNTIEDFYDNINTALDAAEEEDGQPFVYILDSMDSLDSDAARKKDDANRKKRAAGKEEDQKGTYGDGKAKYNSTNLRRVRARVQATNSILIIISQTRDDINPRTFTTKTRSGGKALTFYAHVEFWTAKGSAEKKEVGGEKHVVANQCAVRVKKNRLSGNEGQVNLTIRKNYGVDDIGDCIDYLLKTKHWKKSKQSVVAEEFDFEGSRAKLIQMIEEENMELDLQDLVAEVWSTIQAKLAPKRKKRYG